MQWQVQEAKNKLSEVLDHALKEGPQTITRHGKEVAVLVSLKTYRQLQKKKTSLVDFFKNSPLKGLTLERNPDSRLRKVEL